MKVLITGGAGYIGSVMIREMLDRGYKVKCLDRLFFGVDPIKDLLSDPNFELIRDDIRWFDPEVLRGVDAVVDLAALSNDPSGELIPSKTYDINYLGRIRVARLSKEYGVSRYVFASSCSVYGFQPGIVNENSSLNPLTTYARAAMLAERDLLPLADDRFTVTILRFATAYGLSYRMRFDLAINAMVLALYRNKKIRVMRDGTQWRPFVHVKDISRAVIKVLESDPEVVNGEIFNVGSNEQNYQIYPLARMIGDAIGEPYEIEWYGDPDKRSYRVDFTKIRERLGFRPEYTPERAAREIYEALQEGRVKDELKTYTVKWYKYLLETHKFIKDVEMRGTIL